MDKTEYQNRTEGMHPCLCNACLKARGEELDRVVKAVKREVAEDIIRQSGEFNENGCSCGAWDMLERLLKAEYLPKEEKL